MKLQISKIRIALIFYVILLPYLLNPAEDICSALAGIWSGSVEFPGFKYRIVIIINKIEDFSADIIFPDQSETTYPVDIEVNFPEITIASEKMQLNFAGVYKNDQISGNWNQMKRQMLLVLQKVDKVILPERPQTPQPPFPYQVKEISFGHDRANLSGTLTIPDFIDSYLAVILIPGVGTHDRDNTIFGHKPFWVIADFLTRRGFAVLRYDERGGGKSSGDRSKATSADFAEDVKAGVTFLHSQKYIKKVGLLGHSEGGTIASLVAADDHSIAFIILLGSPGLKGDEYNYQFEESMSRAMGASEAAIERKLELQKEIINLLLKNTDEEKIENEIKKLYMKYDPSLTQEQVQAAINRFLSPWFQYNIRYDPIEVLQHLQCPVLAIFGEKDLQVPPEGNLDAVRSALSLAGNNDCEVIELPGLNHYMQSALTGKPDEYGKIEETISLDLLDKISSWIQKRN
ncbi:MAG: lysophospholipase [Candidatus Cloacimonetes bacterium]|nr:lysophospholipase [Candidatus Cloacimonadota bacterium]